MSSVRKFKEFFGLTPMDGDIDDAYYGDEPGYSESRYESGSYRDRYDQQRFEEPRYDAPQREAGSYFRAEDRSYSCAIVPVEVTSYSDATLIGEPFRDGDAVVFDVSQLNGQDARRIVDFAAGLGFALRGTFKKVSGRVFALIPDGATVTTSQLERAARL